MTDITVNNANGYSGTLHGKEMTIYHYGKEVLHTFDATPTNEEELNECLRTMPQLMRMFDEQDIDEALIDSIELEDIEDSRRGFE